MKARVRKRWRGLYHAAASSISSSAAAELPAGVSPVALTQGGESVVPRDGTGRVSLVFSNATSDLAPLLSGKRRRLRLRSDTLPDILNETNALVYAQPADLVRKVD